MIGDRWCYGTDDERLGACASRTQEARTTFNTRATAVVLCRAVPPLLLSRTRSLIVHITVDILSALITDVWSLRVVFPSPIIDAFWSRSGTT